MTFDDAYHLQETWKANHGGKICAHDQLHANLKSANGEPTSVWICAVCGEAVERSSQECSLTQNNSDGQQ